MKTHDILIAHPQTSEEISVLKAFMQALKIKFEVKEKDYNPEFVAGIRRSEDDFKNGRFTSVKKQDINSYIDGL